MSINCTDSLYQMKVDQKQFLHSKPSLYLEILTQINHKINFFYFVKLHKILIFLNSKKKENKKHIKIIGKKGNNDICKFLLKKVKCFYQSEVKKIYYKNKLWFLLFTDGKIRTYKRVILTCPFPQLKKTFRKIYK